MIYLTSDFHFFHNKDFVYGKRGFENVEDMNAVIVSRFNRIVGPEDDVYILGDLCLGGPDALEDSLKLIEQLNGRLHLVRGNHDTDKRWNAYRTCKNVVEQKNAIYLKYHKYHFFLSHFPCITGNLEKEALTQMTLNIYGHTHQQTNYYKDNPFMYHVGVDSHDCYPVLLDDIVKDMKEKYYEQQYYEQHKEKEELRSEPLKCNNCVEYPYYCSGSGGSCPPGLKYRRDPPDGGYYG